MAISTTPPSEPRLESLDGVRLLTAFGVLLYHYNGEFGLGLEPVVPGLKRVYLLVDLFFVLSGFVIAETYVGRLTSPRAYGAYMARRIGRIYPLHLVTLLATCALAQVFVLVGIWSVLPTHMSLSGLPANLALLQGWGVTGDLFFNYPSWSVSAEMLQYLLFPLYLFLALRMPGWLSAALFLGATIAIAHVYMGWAPWSGYTVDGALRAAPSFFSGVAISVVLRRQTRLPAVTWPMVYAFMAVLLVSLGTGLNDAWIIALDPILILLVVLAEKRSTRTWLRNRVMVLFGQASYAIYMLHIPISVLALGLGRPLLGTGLWASLALCAIALAATLVLSLISFDRFERPAQRMIVRLYDGLGSKRLVPTGPA